MAAQRKLVELIETVVLCHFPDLSRKELEAMIEVSDVRQTKVYQEAKQEGREEGREEVALRLLAQGFSTKEVANMTGLAEGRVKRLKKNGAKP